MYEFIDSTDEIVGTEISRKTLMAMQGFIGMTTERTDDGGILQTNSEGQTLKTKKESDGTITQIFTGDMVLTKTITKIDGKIVEVIS